MSKLSKRVSLYPFYDDSLLIMHIVLLTLSYINCSNTYARNEQRNTFIFWYKQPQPNVEVENILFLLIWKSSKALPTLSIKKNNPNFVARIRLLATKFGLNLLLFLRKSVALCSDFQIKRNYHVKKAIYSRYIKD